jgi:hypothetical protein
MRRLHGSPHFAALQKIRVHCNIRLGLGGLFKRTNAMREIYKPIHSGYETLRLRRDRLGREAHFNRTNFPANEQITALGFEALHRPAALFAQGNSR